jgi:hypothetical protein
MVRYPHILTVTYSDKPVLDTTTGKYTASAKGTYSSVCRAESNSKGTLIINSEGNQVKYAYVVYLPVLDRSFPFGANASLADEFGNIFFKGTVHGFEQLQKSTKLWL